MKKYIYIHSIQCGFMTCSNQLSSGIHPKSRLSHSLQERKLQLYSFQGVLERVWSLRMSSRMSPTWNLIMRRKKSLAAGL